MSDVELRQLAKRAGVAADWVDQSGRARSVAPDVLRAVLKALGVPGDNRAERAASRALLEATANGTALLTHVVTAGEAITVPACLAMVSSAKLTMESGEERPVALRRTRGRRLVMPGIQEIGYHRLQLDDYAVRLAVAPKRCLTVDDIAPGRRLWGLAAQVYGLRRADDGGIGDMEAVAQLSRAAAEAGADAIALSPLHALFAADTTRYGPYAPSSRLFFNPLYAAPEMLFGAERVGAAMQVAGVADASRRLESGPLVEWPDAGRVKLRLLEALFADFLNADLGATISVTGADFRRFVEEQGDRLEEHARFEAIQGSRLSADPGQWSWRMWPHEFRDPQSAAVAEFARDRERDVLFHKFLQWVADRSLAAAQRRAKQAGMKIGLIADMAVGMDGSGSHAWARQQDVLVGLSVGAPPDDFNPRGQNWGLSTFSPRALIETGYAPFLATLRAAMRNAGGIRIDHAMGLMRLWLIPEGAGPGEGAYVTYPLEAMLRLVALESHRHGAIVIGEDLGTVPGGFREQLSDAGIYGMSVLWFERHQHGFTPPERWPAPSVAMTTTHDLPTVAGWWRGADIKARAEAGRPGDDPDGEARQREHDRQLLWSAFTAAGVAEGERPSEDASQAVRAALRYVAKAPSKLALIPLEDILGLEEQPNLPGTIDEHPNWRRRLAAPAADVLRAPAAEANLAALRGEREGA